MHSKLPRSSGSLDLTELGAAPPPPPPPPSAPAHPSLLITDSSGSSSSYVPHNDPFAPPGSGPQLSDQLLLAKFTGAAQTLLQAEASPPTSSAPLPNPAHLSVTSLAGEPNPRTLSRISEASEYSQSSFSPSAYGARESLPSSNERPSTPPPRTISVSSSLRSPSPALPAFTFPAPPSHAHLPPPQPVLPGSPKKHHLPTRPLTTPLPAMNPALVPVPIDVFARPPGQERVGSPYGGMQQQEPVMVQLPGRAAVLPARHAHNASESSSAWATAEDEKGSFSSASKTGAQGGVFFPGDGYDSLSLQQTQSTNNRFTLDAEPKAPRGAPGGQESGKKGNRRVWIALLLLAVVGIAVGVGVGVGKKRAASSSADSRNDLASAAFFSSASPTSSSPPLDTVLLPTSSSASFSSASPSAAVDAPQTYSTTFGFSRSGATTVVPLTYTVPTSGIQTRSDGRWQFTEEVVLPAAGSGSGAGGSFTSDLRFRIQPTGTGSSAADGAQQTDGVARKRDLQSERMGERRWERREVSPVARHQKARMARVIR
ncbi:hypothetical protein JCM10213_003166 [Rhodosporidiobolus nylandii]